MSSTTYRTCPRSGLQFEANAEKLMLANAVAAVVFLLIGGILAVGVVLTRWPAIHWLEADTFYKVLTAHGIDMLIFWIIFFEIAVLYFCSSTLLRCRLATPKIAWLAFALMVIGAIVNNVAVYQGSSSVMMTSYVPMMAAPSFYLGLILFAVGALIACFVFLGTLVVAKAEKTYQGSVPLVTFGAITAAIIAVFTIVSIGASISAMVLAGPRVYFAMARDGLFAAPAARVHPKFRAPVSAILAQTLWSSVLVLCGSLSQLVSYTGFAVVLFSGIAVARSGYARNRRPGCPAGRSTRFPPTTSHAPGKSNQSYPSPSTCLTLPRFQFQHAAPPVSTMYWAQRIATAGYGAGPPISSGQHARQAATYWSRLTGVRTRGTSLLIGHPRRIWPRERMKPRNAADWHE